MKRKIPTIQFNFHGDVGFNDVLKNIPINLKEEIYKETLNAIKDGINNNKNNTVLFEIYNQNCYINLPKEKWTNVLQSLIKIYTEREDYDKCIEIRNLNQKINING